MIIPAFDISDRLVAQLKEGQKIGSVGDPLDLAGHLALVGDIAIYDFDLSITVKCCISRAATTCVSSLTCSLFLLGSISQQGYYP